MNSKFKAISYINKFLTKKNNKFPKIQHAFSIKNEYFNHRKLLDLPLILICNAITHRPYRGRIRKL